MYYFVIISIYFIFQKLSFFICGFENVIFPFIFIIFYILASLVCDVFIYLLYFLVDQGLPWILCCKKVLVVLKKPLDLVPISSFSRFSYGIWLSKTSEVTLTLTF